MVVVGEKYHRPLGRLFRLGTVAYAVNDRHQRLAGEMADKVAAPIGSLSRQGAIQDAETGRHLSRRLASLIFFGRQPLAGGQYGAEVVLPPLVGYLLGILKSLCF